MKVYGIHSGYSGCCYVRLHIPFSANGFDQDIPSRTAKRKSPELVRQELQQADVVVFHRAEEQAYHDLAKLLKKDGKKIVMDNDDTFEIDDFHPLLQFRPDGTYQENLKRRQDNVNEFVKISDLVTVSTPFLQKEYQKINPNVVVLPNYIKPEDWDDPLRNETSKVRIGIMGSAAMEYDYEHIKPLLRKLSDRDDVRLVLFGLGDLKHRRENPRVTEAFKDDYDFWDSVNVEQFPWVKSSDYQDTLNETRLDLLLIPRRDNYFNRCKSNVKFLEASMYEIPVIAQSFSDGPYEEITPDIGRLVKGSDWDDTVEELIQDEQLRKTIGKNAKDYVLNNYNIYDHAYKWVDAYNNLFN